MRLHTSVLVVTAAAAAMSLVEAVQSPFFYSNQFKSKYSKTGKMEQIGHTGVAAMHAVLLNERSILIIDKAETNVAKLDSGVDAYSTLYDTETNTYRTLLLETNTFCSAGGFLANGTFISTGGAEPRGRWNAAKGHQSIRQFQPCSDASCIWHEYPSQHMFMERWYPTVEQLPEGDIIIVGGSTTGTKYNRKEINVPSLEFWPPRTTEPVELDFLKHTLPYNLYPFVFVLPDGNLFMFASKKSIIYDYKNNKVIRELPEIKGVPRSYPLTGGAVMLPLDPANNYNVEILVCGGSKETKDTSPADDTCGRINLGDKEPKWEMETFVHKRLMPDGVLLLDGTVLWVNGCQRGWAGYNNRNHDPTFDPLIYDPTKPKAERWTQGLANTDIARMYHSVALTLPDGRVWIAGSNNVDPPDLYAEYPTEYRVEYFSPPYLFKSETRPHYSQLPRVVTYGQTFNIQLHIERELQGIDKDDAEKIRVAVIRPGFSTHSMHMSQRYVYLVHQVAADFQSLEITAPPNANIFPPGQGFLVVLYDGVPSKASEFFIEHNVEDLAI